MSLYLLYSKSAILPQVVALLVLDRRDYHCSIVDSCATAATLDQGVKEAA